MIAAARSLAHLLERSCERDAGHEAIFDESRRLSYGELWQSICKLATFFRSQGFTPGSRVALYSEASLDYVIAYYAVAAAGGVSVPLNAAAHPAESLRLIEHTEPVWVLIDGELPHALTIVQKLPPATKVLAIGGVTRLDGAKFTALADALGSVNGHTSAAATVHANDAASIIYTSGTTGRPKGVVLSHGNLVSNVEAVISYLGLGPDDRTVSPLPLYYSYGNSVLHTHLAAGAAIGFERSLAYPPVFMERLKRERATGLSGVPSTFALLVKRGAFEKCTLPTLRYITQAGGAMPHALTEELRSRLPGARLYLMYGQTEAAARLAFLPPEALSDKHKCVGRPIPGVQIEVRNELGARTAPREVGELWAAGPNVMLGYWRDPEASAAAIVAGWLRTGDLGFVDEDGFLYLVGRRTEMIKTGAHRIAPEEIEEVIRTFEDVDDVAVVGVPDEILGQAIKAYVVPIPGASLDTMTLRAHCRQLLPMYKVPKYVELASLLPRTSSGKLQRSVLAHAGSESAND